ncbi:TerC family protein [Bacillus timonensis]|uniref:TerC family protein n=1 Tax=Bacillus timonensis TaxID=1033734 RepID=UPI0002881292|nr:TerC family protein [Bacillus timonensis]
MELFSAEFFSTLLAIVVIDLVLAGDNAIVIGLAARNLPKEQQKRAIIWGTVGAIIIRAAATLAVVWLLKLPGLHLLGGILLIWIAYKLLTDEQDDHEIEAKGSFVSAVRTIIVADALMGLDNVLGVAGAAHGSFLLVILGLIISVPIMVWGSTLFIKLIDRFPIIVTIGSAILAWTAAKMIVGEPFLQDVFDNPWFKYTFEVLVIIAVVLIGTKMKKTKAQSIKEKQKAS